MSRRSIVNALGLLFILTVCAPAFNFVERKSTKTLFTWGCLLVCGFVATVAVVEIATNAPATGVIEVNESNFNREVLQSPIPVYAFVYADDECAFCRDQVSRTEGDIKERYVQQVQTSKEQAPIVEALAKKYSGKVKFVKIDFLPALLIAHATHTHKAPAHLFLKIADGKIVEELRWPSKPEAFNVSSLNRFLRVGLGTEGKATADGLGVETLEIDQEVLDLIKS